MTLKRIVGACLCALLVACSATRQLAPASTEELARYVLFIRELPDGTVTHSWQPAGELDLSRYQFLSSMAGSTRRIVPAMAGRHRDCDQENDECLDKCMGRPLPPGFEHIGVGPGARARKAEYCRGECWQAYRDCIELEKRRPQEFTAIDTATDWLKRNHKEVLLGSVVIIAGVAFIVISAGAGLVILAPAALLASPMAETESFMAEAAP